MIPENKTKEVAQVEKEKIGSFDFFNIEHFIKRLIKNWYWFLIFFE